MNKNSILFVNPDYHCTFIYAAELKKLGWNVSVIVGPGYPDELLYSNEAYIFSYDHNNIYISFLLKIWANLKFFYASFFYSYIIVYGDLNVMSFGLNHVALSIFFGNSFRPHLSLLRLFGKKIVVVPSGCLEEETKANFSKLDSGNVCANCGWAKDVCKDIYNVARFDVVRRYASAVVGNGSLDSTQFRTSHIKYKAINLDFWNPNTDIPEKFLLNQNGSVKILHSFFSKGRLAGGRNIKGSPFIICAVDRLKSEGHDVELIDLNNIPSKHMRFYQVQADIIVDQLIYGWWGSTGVEAMALGKPLVCYLRPSWKEFFLHTFPEYADLPVIEGTTSSIYKILKNLVVDRDLRLKKGKESRIFAEKHFDAKANAVELENFLHCI